MMASVDKKTKKGMTEKDRVKRNGEEIQAICKLLGLPKKTSKANLLRAAVMFIIKYHKGIDISDMNVVASQEKNRQSEKTKLVQIKEEESIDQQLPTNYPELCPSFLIKTAGSQQESSSSFSSDQSGDNLFCSEKVGYLEDSEDETTQMQNRYLSNTSSPVQNGNEKPVIVEEGLSFFPPLSSNPSSPFCPLSSDPSSPFPPSPHRSSPFPPLSSSPFPPLSSSPSYDNQPQPPSMPSTVFFSTNPQWLTSPPSPSYYHPFQLQTPPLHHLPWSPLNSPSSTCMQNLLYPSLLDPVIPGQKELH